AEHGRPQRGRRSALPTGLLAAQSARAPTGILIVQGARRSGLDLQSQTKRAAQVFTHFRGDARQVALARDGAVQLDLHADFGFAADLVNLDAIVHHGELVITSHTEDPRLARQTRS